MKIINMLEDTLGFVILFTLLPIISVIHSYYRRDWRFTLYGIMEIPFYYITISTDWCSVLSLSDIILNMSSGVIYLFGVYFQVKLMSKYKNEDKEKRVYRLTHLI